MDQFTKSVAEAKKELKKVATNLFREVTQELFDEYPNLKSFGWSQYTPYFNDGETCTFSVNGSYPTINGYNTNTGEYEDGEEGDEPAFEELEPEVEERAAAVSTLLNAIPDEVMLEMFGDHQKITVTRKGITQEDYSHD